MSVAPSSRRLLNPALIDSRMDNYCEVAVLGLVPRRVAPHHRTTVWGI